MTDFVVERLILYGVFAVAAMISMIVHELAKYYSSLMLMHPIHRKRNDANRSWLSFIDPIGVVFFTFSLVCWQKPADYNPVKYKDKNKGFVIVMIMGYLFSTLLVVISLSLPVFRLLSSTQLIHRIMGYLAYGLAYSSFSLMIVNLIPIPPLDMTHVIQQFNIDGYINIMKNQRSLQALLLLLIIFGILREIIVYLFSSVTLVLGGF